MPLYAVALALLDTVERVKLHWSLRWRFQGLEISGQNESVKLDRLCQIGVASRSSLDSWRLLRLRKAFVSKEQFRLQKKKRKRYSAN